MNLKILFFSFVLVAPLYAQARQPPPKEKSVKQQANDSLDSVEKGVKDGARETKKAANDALWAVDRGVHKVITPEKKDDTPTK